MARDAAGYAVHDARIPFLEFVQETGGRIEDPASKLRIRRKAASTKSGSKRHPVVQFSLEIPDAFVRDVSKDQPDPPDCLVNPSNQTEHVQAGTDNSDDQSNSLLPFGAVSTHLDDAVLGPSHSLQLYPWTPELIMFSKQTEDRWKPDLVHPARKSRPRRASKPKVRSGCITCKARRVKCDETKPACMRCLRLYGMCDGYPEFSILSSRESPRLSLLRPSTALPFRGNLESLYFRAFQEETASELTGIFNSTFWNRIVLQECYNEEFVRHAVVAIGALNKSFKADWTAGLCSKSTAESWQILAANHREFAFKAYGASLRKMRSISWGEPRHFRRNLIACLLVFVFENFSGQVDMAFSHALIGDHLACEFVTHTPHTRPHTAGLSSPASGIVEDDLLSAYVQLSIQMMTFTDQRSLEKHQTGKVTCSTTIASMPSIFSSLMEARLYWGLIMRRSCHYASTAYVATQSARLQRVFSNKSLGRVVEVASGSCIYSSPYAVPEWLHIESARYSADLDCWSSAFQPLLDHARLEPGVNTGALLLRMYTLSTKIVVKGTVFVEESSYDQLVADFHEIVALARHVSDAFSQQPAFRLDLSIVPPLFIVILRCRDRHLRREALAILGSSKCKDGPWDRQMMAKAGSWIVEKEEEGVVSIRIPEQARVRFSGVMMSLEKRSMMLQFVRRRVPIDGPGAEEPQLMWEEVTINGW